MHQYHNGQRLGIILVILQLFNLYTAVVIVDFVVTVASTKLQATVRIHTSSK